MKPNAPPPQLVMSPVFWPTFARRRQQSGAVGAFSIVVSRIHNPYLTHQLELKTMLRRMTQEYDEMADRLDEADGYRYRRTIIDRLAVEPAAVGNPLCAHIGVRG
jgi:hypothetical protein